MIRDRELAGLAMTLGRDAKMKITVSGEESFCKPDGSHINIARMPSTPLGRMLMTGLVFHEVGHRNYSSGSRPDGLLGDLMNVIEDTWVDMKTIAERPGTCFNLEAVTTHYVKKGSLRPVNIAHALVGKVMGYGFGRILKHEAILPMEELCDEMMEDAFGHEFVEEVEEIIRDIPNLSSSAESTAMAQRLVDLLIHEQKKSQPRAQQRKATSGKKSKGNSSGNSAAATAVADDPTRMDQRGTKKGRGKKNNSSCQDAGEKPHEQGDASGSGGTGSGSDNGNRPSWEEIEEMLCNSSGFGDLSALIRSELDELAVSVNGDDRSMIPMLPVIGRNRSSNSKLNEVEAISASSRMRAKLLGMLQSVKRKPASYGLSGRKLASGRLSRLAIGDPKVFRRKVETVDIHTAVMVLVDLSGSMNGRHVVANTAAFALHTTLFGISGVAVCSAEFSGKKNRPDVNVLVDFGRKPLSENFNLYPCDGTPTHEAIWAARSILLQRHEPRRIMLILTDGCPDKDDETRGATKRAMADGIEIAAIGIMDSHVERFWENHRVIHSMQELPSAMFGVMEGLLTRRVIS